MGCFDSIPGRCVYGICGRHLSIRRGFHLSTFLSPCSITPQIISTHNSFIYPRHCTPRNLQSHYFKNTYISSRKKFVSMPFLSQLSESGTCFVDVNTQLQLRIMAWTVDVRTARLSIQNSSFCCYRNVIFFLWLTISSSFLTQHYLV